MRRLHRVRSNHEMGGKIVERVGRVCQLRGIPVLKDIGITAGSDKPCLWIYFSHGVAECLSSLRNTRQSGVSDLEIAPEFIAQLPQQAAGVICPMSVNIGDPVCSLLWSSGAE